MQGKLLEYSPCHLQKNKNKNSIIFFSHHQNFKRSNNRYQLRVTWKNSENLPSTFSFKENKTIRKATLEIYCSKKRGTQEKNFMVSSKQ